MIKLRDLVSRIRLILDKSEADKVERDASRPFTNLEKLAYKVGAAIGAAFALDRIVRWGSAAVRAAVEADAIWNRLDGTLKRAGTSMAAVGAEIEAAARAMQDATTVGDEDFAGVLHDLMTITGNYEDSLRNVGVVADFAAAKQIDLRTAALIVGRAMIGETGTLSRYGVVVQEGADAVEQMRRQFAGAAENEVRTLAGQFEQVKNEAGDAAEAVGGFLLRVLDGDGPQGTYLTRMKLGLQAIAELFDRIKQTPENIVAQRIGGGTVEQRLAAARKELERLNRELFIEQMDAREAPRLSAAGIPIPRTRTTTQAEINAAEKIIRDLENYKPPADVETADERELRLEREKAAAEARLKAIEAEKELLRNSVWVRPGMMGEDAIAESPTGIILHDLQLIPQEIQTVTSAFQSMFSLITIDGETAQATLTQLGVALATGGMGGIARLAKAKAGENIARAVEEGAQGFGALARGNPGAALHFKAAAEHGIAAGLWKVLGGSIGGGSRTSSSAGISSSARDLSGGASRDAKVLPPEVHIYIDPLSASDPRVVRTVYAATEIGRRYYGEDAVVHTHPYPRQGT